MYSARIDGKPTIFGTSGIVYRSNKLMYDRETKTLWSSLLESPLSALWRIEKTSNWRYPPVAPTIWCEWLAEHPDTSVLSPLNDFYRPIVYPREDYYKSTYYRYRPVPKRCSLCGIGMAAWGPSQGFVASVSVIATKRIRSRLSEPCGSSMTAS